MSPSKTLGLQDMQQSKLTGLTRKKHLSVPHCAMRPTAEGEFPSEDSSYLNIYQRSIDEQPVAGYPYHGTAVILPCCS